MSYGKNGNHNGSDATQSSSYHNLWMLLAQHKNYLRLWRNRNIWWSHLYLLWNPKALWASCICVAQAIQHILKPPSGKQVIGHAGELKDKNMFWLLKGVDRVR